jgi:hypothetical protein
VLKVFRVSKVFKVTLVLLAQPVLRARKAQLVLKVTRELLGLQAQIQQSQDQLVLLVLKVCKVFKVPQDLRVQLAFKVFKVLKDLQVQPVHKEILVQLDQLALKVFKA